MKEKIKKQITTNTITTFVADDGKEFEYEKDCLTYEYEQTINKLKDKYNLQCISVPSFIAEDVIYGYSFSYPKDGDIDEIKNILQALMACFMENVNCETWKVCYLRDFSNVREESLAFDNLEDFFVEGKKYIFLFSHEECCDTWDYFYKNIISEDLAKKKLIKSINEFEKIFECKLKLGE